MGSLDLRRIRLLAPLVLLMAMMTTGSADAATRTCTTPNRNMLVPTWARAGFSAKEPRMPLVRSAHDRIVALLFGDPLRSPPSRERSNKILWVSRRPVTGLTNLAITARRTVGGSLVGAAVHRTVAGGPGPSIIDLPGAGCWHMALRWAGRSDTIWLRYTKAP